MKDYSDAIFAIETQQNNKIYGEQSCTDKSLISSVARAKRFLEAWSIDNKLRERLLSGMSDEFVSSLGINISDFRPLWDPCCTESIYNDTLSQYISFLNEKIEIRNRIRQDGTPDNPILRQWRQRQINRFLRQAGVQHASSVVHATFAVELNQGCSVGCWFCAVDAPKLEKSFSYTKSNMSLWRDVLHSLKLLIGSGAKTGFCYWATDPMDNPEYENFISDFESEFGHFPQTTTAQPLKHINRIRSLIANTSGMHRTINRFSILSIRAMYQIFEQFSPEELLHVELVPQNRESIMIKANAGRARGKVDLSHSASFERQPSTIACVSGFLVNMVNKTVLLISPVPASDMWPLGYQIHGEEHFHDASSFKTACDKLVARIKNRLRVDDVISIDSDIECKMLGSSILLTQKGYSFNITGTDNISLVSSIISRLKNSEMSLFDLAVMLEEISPISETFYLIDTLFRAGLINEVPAK